MSTISDDEKKRASDEKVSVDIIEKVVLEDDVYKRDHEEGVDRTYQLKSAMIDACLEHEIGMGWFQWELFCMSGFGWAADNMWLQAIAIVLPQVGNEFIKYNTKLPWITFSTYIGMLSGCILWGVLSDVIGRRWSWNITLFVGSAFGMAIGGSPNFIALGALTALMAFGIGGNLPVDGALYLEFIPHSHQWTLTFLSWWWSFGQLVASLIGWVFIANYSCPDATPGGPACLKRDNMGWRYTLIVLGAITFVMWVLRIFVFRLKESPKWLVGQGRDAEAIAVLELAAKRNRKTISLTVEKLRTANPAGASSESDIEAHGLSTTQQIWNSASKFSFSHLKPLYSTKRLAVNTTLIALIWGLVGLAYPLFYAYLPIFLAQHSAINGGGVNETYRNYTITSVLGIPGSMIAGLMVEWTRKRGPSGYTFGGRRFAMASSTALTGVFLFLFTTASTNSAVLGYSCATSLTSNAMYGVLYAYTPEAFPAPHRGTGDAFASGVNRMLGLLSPIVALYANLQTHAPIYVAATLFLVASILMLLLPIETAGKAAL